MKCKMKKNFGAYDTGQDLKLKFKPLMFGFQDVVAEHSRVSGCGMEWLLGQQKAWVMHRICIHVHQMPKLGEDLSFLTWHKGDQGYRAYRDYEVWCGPEKRVSAASLWLFIDLERNRIMKIPQESRQWYSVETDNALAVDIDAFKSVKKNNCPIVEKMTLRNSDFDPIGHVNNAIYLDLLETAVDRCFEGRKKIEKVMIQFNKEITNQMVTVDIGITEEEDNFRFNIISDSDIHAFGDFSIVKTT